MNGTISLLTLAVLLLGQQENRQPTDDVAEAGASAPAPEPRLGEITGTNVYVRSGPATNYYPVARMSHPQRVIVVGELFKWLAIAPPAGSFSLVEQSYVDPEGQTGGVINGNHVWVTAGTELSGEHYAKQVQLNRGAAVEILGELGEYYKIVPPQGAALYISQDYVRVLSEPVSAAALASPAPAAVADPSAALQPGTQTAAGDPASAGAAQAMPPAPGEKAETSSLKAEIDQIEADLAEEFTRDALDRNLAPFIERFRKIAGQKGDVGAQRYAESRVQQLEGVARNTEALREIRALRAAVEADRAELLKERANIKPAPVQLSRDYVVRGQLLKSFAYESPVGARRYRIVDPADHTHRTIAYVEIEPDSGIDGETFLGRHVGVRAKGQHLLEGAVDPVVVYTAAEIVLLEQAGE